MANLLSNIYNYVQTFSSTNVDPYQVIEAKSSDYAHRRINFRDDSLVVYEPHNENQNYEVVLLKPMDFTSNVYSIFRTKSQEEAESTFDVLKDKLPLFVENQKYTTTSLIQKISETLRSNPGWNLMHVVIHLNMKQMFLIPAILKFKDDKCVHTGKTPLQVAVELQQLHLVQAILELEVDLSIICNNGNTVYHYAATTTKEIIDILSKKSIDHIDSFNHIDQSPLQLACLEDKPDCVKALLKAGADVNYVVRSRHPSMQVDGIDQLATRSAGNILHLYPNQLDITDIKNGGTPLHWSKSELVLEALIEAGCEVDTPNFKGDTALHIMVLRERLSCVIGLLSHGANVNLKGDGGNTALHYAVKIGNLPIIETLIVFAADLDCLNDNRESPRHIAATTKYTTPFLISFIPSSSNERKAAHILYCLHAVGARRCVENVECCQSGCLKDGDFDGIPFESTSPITSREKYFDRILNSFCDSLNSRSTSQTCKRVSALCLDGGGIRGLVLIKMLMMMEFFLEDEIINCFDWIAGTSTGGIICLGLASGKSVMECLRLYFRLKSKVFKGNRPYDSCSLEEFLKKELGGDDFKMTDLKSDAKVFVTGLVADNLPAYLHLFRNYTSPRDLVMESDMEIDSVDGPTSSNSMLLKPADQPVWLAARATGAAPTYFEPCGNIIDGGLIANNPTLDLLTELDEYNQVLSLLNMEDEKFEVSCIVSLGTGRLPTVPLSDINFTTTFKAVRSASSLASLLVDQATLADGQVVQRARSWCRMIGVPYMRLNPELSSRVTLDEINNEVLIHMLWETMVYMLKEKDSIRQLRKHLKPHVITL